MNSQLPRELTIGATIRDKEYAWELSAFPEALQRAPALGYTCLGGQFWFVLSDTSLLEPFWLEANSSDRLPGEAWSGYAQRSCEEVSCRIQHVDERGRLQQSGEQVERPRSRSCTPASLDV